MSMRTKAIVAVIIASILWGTAGVAAKTLVRDVSPFVASFYRFLIASCLIVPFFLRERRSRFAWRELVPLSLIGALNVPLFFLGIQMTTANAATLIYTATPLATAFLSSILIKEIHSVQRIVGIIIGLFGAILITLLPIVEKNQSVVGNLKGNLLVFCAMFFWTLYAVGSRHILNKKSYSPLTITSIYFFVTAFVSFSMSVVTGQQFFPPALFTQNYLFTLLYSSIFITLITYFLFQWAIQHISVTTASLKQYIEPVVGVLLNMLILGETISSGFLLGSILVFFGVFIATGTAIVTGIKKKLNI